MSFKTTVNKEFRGKGFVNLEKGTFISTGKKDEGEEYSLNEVFQKIGGNGDEIQLAVKLTDVADTVEDE